MPRHQDATIAGVSDSGLPVGNPVTNDSGRNLTGNRVTSDSGAEPGLGEGRPPANTGNPVTSYSARQAANTGPPGTSYSAEAGERAYRGTPITRECPVCGESFAVHPGPGRPQVYCSERCRWRAGHEADARARHKLMAEQNRQSYEDLLAWAGRQHFREPY